MKEIYLNFYEFTGVINPSSLGMKETFEKFEEFVNHEPELRDLQAFSLVLLNIHVDLYYGGKTVETAIYSLNNSRSVKIRPLF